jgi:hypothetical protein
MDPLRDRCGAMRGVCTCRHMSIWEPSLAGDFGFRGLSSLKVAAHQGACAPRGHVSCMSMWEPSLEGDFGFRWLFSKKLVARRGACAAANVCHAGLWELSLEGTFCSSWAVCRAIEVRVD